MSRSNIRVELMRNSIMTNPIRAVGLVAALVIGPILACTDLTEVPTSSITPEQYYKNESEVTGGLAAVYAIMQRVGENPYNLSEITTDEMVVPTRGQDWYDNGKWLDMHRQTFTPNSAAAADNMVSAWNDLFTGVARATVLIKALDNVSFTNKPRILAEARALRAYYYFLLQDLFGGVPIVTDLAVEARPRDTRAAVYAFIDTELNAARADLPDTVATNDNGRLTKFSVDAILASLYLNSEVFTGTVTTTGLTKGTAHWTEAVAACDRIINSGNYALAANWRSNFTADNYSRASTREIIWAAKFVNQAGLGLHFLMTALHYNQYTPSPWNGFSTLAETYNAFDPADTRRQIFLIGPQVNIETGVAVTQRDKVTPLVFTTTIADVTAATEAEGVRITKWPNDPGHVAQDNGNDYATFRLAEIYLIKAEALNEQSAANTVAAINLINTVRARNFNPAKPLALTLTQAQVRDAVLAERLFELTAEGKRRQDLIRMNKFTQGTWSFKTSTLAYKILMPIPQGIIDNNPKLTQNPGYGN